MVVDVADGSAVAFSRGVVDACAVATVVVDPRDAWRAPGSGVTPDVESAVVVEAGEPLEPFADRAEPAEMVDLFAAEEPVLFLADEEEFGWVAEVPPSSARATPVVEKIAAPIPSATANAPTRPT